MSFAVAGLRVPGLTIRRPEVVTKSFPDFWQVFEQLYAVLESDRSDGSVRWHKPDPTRPPQTTGRAS